MTTLNSRLQLALLNRKKGRNLIEKGFTLVELLIVVVILGILTGVALPNFLKQADRARVSGANTAAKSAASSYASLAAVGETSEFKLPDGLSQATGSCDASDSNDTSGITFTTKDADYPGLTTQAIATVCGTGVELTSAS